MFHEKAPDVGGLSEKRELKKRPGFRPLQLGEREAIQNF